MFLLMPSLCCPVVFRDRRGHVLQPAPFQSSAKSGDVARVEPNKKWFGELVMGIPWMLLTNLPLVWSHVPKLESLWCAYKSSLSG